MSAVFQVGSAPPPSLWSLKITFPSPSPPHGSVFIGVRVRDEPCGRAGFPIKCCGPWMTCVRGPRTRCASNVSIDLADNRLWGDGFCWGMEEVPAGRAAPPCLLVLVLVQGQPVRFLRGFLCRAPSSPRTGWPVRSADSSGGPAGSRPGVPGRPWCCGERPRGPRRLPRVAPGSRGWVRQVVGERNVRKKKLGAATRLLALYTAVRSRQHRGDRGIEGTRSRSRQRHACPSAITP